MYFFNRSLQLVIIYLVWTVCFSSTLSTYQKKIAALEASSGGRIGVSAINTGNNHRLKYRADERFPMGCTSKVMGVAAVLQKSMREQHLLQQKISYAEKSLTTWSPITRNHIQTGMTILALSAAAISASDNTAMNLLVQRLGGIAAMNAFARSIGDFSFHQDHDWPKEACSGGPNNVYDSSTPAAMEKSLHQLGLGKVLAKPQRQLLISWLKKSTTGPDRIRAGIPKHWEIGNKTGTGAYFGTTNDIAILWPPKCAPIVVAIYYTHPQKTAEKRPDIVAAVTRILVGEFAEHDRRLK